MASTPQKLAVRCCVINCPRIAVYDHSTCTHNPVKVYVELGTSMKVQGLPPQVVSEVASNWVMTVAEGLEAPVQLTYLSLLLALLSGAAFAVVRQVLVRREMDERSKVLGELIRTGDATSEDYFELGVVLARKRLYTQALKNYTKAVKLWDGEDVELAQVCQPLHPSHHQILLLPVHPGACRCQCSQSSTPLIIRNA